MFSRWAEGGAGDDSDARIFEEDTADLFGAGPGTSDVDPGIERAFGMFAAKSWDLIQVPDELFPAPSKLGNHAGSVSLTIPKRIDSGVLSEFCHAGVAVDGHHRERGCHFGWRDRVAEPPSCHRETLREAVNDQSALFHAGVTQHGQIFAAVGDARIDFIGENP